MTDDRRPAVQQTAASGIHGTDEHLPVADLLKATKVVAAVTMAWCGIAE